MRELWKPIEGFEGLYEVSNLGRVRSLDREVVREYRSKNPIAIKGKELKGDYTKEGYKVVTLYKEGRRKRAVVNRLVATAFIPNPDPESKTQINHKDEIKDNNIATNLEWCTPKYNSNYGTRTKRFVNKMLNKRGKEIEGVNIKTGDKIQFRSLMEAERAGFRSSNICMVCKGDRKSHKGYYWRYLDSEEEKTS